MLIINSKARDDISYKRTIFHATYDIAKAQNWETMCTMSMIPIFWGLGNNITNTRSFYSYNIKMRSFKSIFGITPYVFARLWKLLLENTCLPSQLLWELCFFKCYSKEDVSIRLFGVNSKTYREAVWRFVKTISSILNVRFFNLNQFKLIIQI